jgi:hypothetical protein
MCNDCYCANVSRTPWRGKATKDDKKKSERRSNLKPGDVVSIDQLESLVPGFSGQQTGILTRQRIVGSSVYVDHASDLSYIYHHTALASEETVKGKEAFEAYAKAHGVRISTTMLTMADSRTTPFLKAFKKIIKPSASLE